MLPNPFEDFGFLMSMLINAAITPILHFAAYKIVGMIYSADSFPAWGSFLYLVVYSALIGLLSLMAIFNFAWWWILTIAVALVIIFVGINHVLERIR